MYKPYSSKKNMETYMRKKEKTLPNMIAETQAVFNRWIRERDKNLSCICCGSFNTAHAAHYFSAGNHSSLRFSEMNVNSCCVKCNTFLHGNLINYRHGLIKKYGEANVKLLELSASLNRVKKWSRFELVLIIEKYKL